MRTETEMSEMRANFHCAAMLVAEKCVSWDVSLNVVQCEVKVQIRQDFLQDMVVESGVLGFRQETSELALSNRRPKWSSSPSDSSYSTSGVSVL